jgi:hypothetical protein
MELMHSIDLRRQMDASGYALVRQFLPKKLLNILRAVKMGAGSIPSAQPHLGTVTGIERCEDFASGKTSAGQN